MHWPNRRSRLVVDNIRLRQKLRKEAQSLDLATMNLCLVSLLLLLVPIGADWIDPDTPMDARTTMPYNIKIIPFPKPPLMTTAQKNSNRTKKLTRSPAPTQSARPSESPSWSPTEIPTFTPKEFRLVFSDEFNTPQRSFEDGVDPRWTALDKNDYTNGALHYYSPQNVKTEDGHLVITSEAGDTEIIGFNDVKLQKTHVTKHFRSAMVQSWNKFCVTGGIIEAEVILPGKAQVGGLWPAFWLLGNLARHTYVGSSEHIWPWSSLICTKKSGWAQKISGCDEVAHYGKLRTVDCPSIDLERSSHRVTDEYGRDATSLGAWCTRDRYIRGSAW